MKHKTNKYSFSEKNNKTAFKKGIIDGIPIGLCYLAVAFSLGVIVKSANFTPFQGFITSLFCLTSTGEYLGFTLIAAGATFLEIALITFIANARYLLMGCAMSQRIESNIPFFHRLCMAFGITDEIFGITISQTGYLNPYYTYGAVAIAAPSWALGTAIGTVAGNFLPARLLSAFSVALFGMFLATLVPVAKKNKIIAILIIISFMASYAATYIPVISQISDGTRIIILTVILSSCAAILFPKKPEQEEDK